MAAGWILAAGAIACQADPGDLWLREHGLMAWQWDLDLDFDGLTVRQEYTIGGDPLGSDPPYVLQLTGTGSDLSLAWDAIPGQRFQVAGSANHVGYTNYSQPVIAVDPSPSLKVDPLPDMQFLRLSILTPLDRDGDGLSDLEEGLISFTDPDLRDTDSDTIPDDIEAIQNLGDPREPDTAGGRIEGQVVNDPDGDGDLVDGIPVEGARVYLDLDFDGTMGPDDAWLETASDGTFAFGSLSPGVYFVRQVLPAATLQTAPAVGATPLGDGLADELIEYHQPPTGPFPTPYGLMADEFAAFGYIRFPVVPEPVDPELVLKPIGRRADVPAVGAFPWSEWLTMPQDSTLLLRYDEWIVDGPGDDLLVYSIDASANEKLEVSVGPSSNQLTLVGTLIEAPGGSTIDLTIDALEQPIRYVQLRSLDNAGSFPGFDLVGVVALNYATPSPGAHVVEILATETVSGRDFGRWFNDRPPTVFVAYDAPGIPARIGDQLQVQVSAHDDVAVATRHLAANGQAVNLGTDHSASLTLTEAGAVNLVATATDSSGQLGESALTVYVAYPDGTLPFDPAYLPLDSGVAAGAPEIQFLSPATGSAPTNDVPVVVTVDASSDVEWELDYAPFDQVDPLDLLSPDPDYIRLGAGTGEVTNASLADFPAGSLPLGVYLLRLTARAQAGSPTAAEAMVLGAGLDPSSLAVTIELTDPAAGTEVTLTRDIIGSIRSDRPITEWYLELAPAHQVDVNNPGSSEPDWLRIAEGTGTVENAVLGTLDATRIANGSYLLRAVAWNDLLLGRVEGIPMEIVGQAKLGRLVREFTDLSISLAGFPLEVRRVYDSFAADTLGDFGYGWRLGYLDPDIQETVPDTGSDFFGAMPFRDGTRVYLDTPNGERVGFTFRPEIGATSFLGAVYRAVFEADPGVYYQLEVPEGDTPFLTLDANGKAHLYFFGVAYNPSRYVLITPEQDRYTFDEREGFIEAEDANGNRLTAVDDGFVHSLGPRLTIERDGQGRVTRITNPEGLAWTYAYDLAGDLVGVTTPELMETTFSYYADPAHHLNEVVDPFGRTGIAYAYDADGRLVAIIDEDGNRVEQQWSPAAFTGSVKDRRGHTTLLEYDERGNIIRQENPLRGVTTFEFADPAHPDLPTTITDANLHVTRFTYGANGKLIEQLNPMNFRETFSATYDPAGRVLSVNDVDGRISTYAYDQAGNMISRAPAFTPTEQFEYSAQGRPVKTIAADGFETARTYDAAGQLSRVEHSDGVSLDIVTNPSGHLESATDAEDHTWSFTFSSDGVPQTQTDPMGRSRTVTRLPDGSFESIDRTGRRTVYALDTDEQPRLVTLPDLSEIAYTFDDGRSVTGVTDAVGNTTTFNYDPLGRNTGGEDAAAIPLTVAYDPVGNVTEVIDRNGKRRTFEYDANDRLLFERWHGATGEVVRVFGYTYSRGRLYAVTDGAARWDVSGRLPRPTTWNVTYPGQTTWIVGYDWGFNDSAPGPVSITVRPDRQSTQGEVHMAYEGMKLRGLSWKHPDGDGGQLQYGFAPDGEIDRIVRFPVSGTSQPQTAFSETRYALDPMNFVTGISHLDGAGAPLAGAEAMALIRDAEGRVTGVEQDADTAVVQLDALGQITGVTHTAFTSELYTYDAVGNRLASHLTAGPATVDPGNRLRTLGDFTFAYDLEGNLVERIDTVGGEVRRFEYDHRNQLVRATVHPSSGAAATTELTYAYDFAQRMVSRTRHGVKTWILWDRLMPIAEFPDGAEEISAFFFYRPDRMDHYLGAWREGVGERWFLTDHIGTVRGTLDGTGTLVGWTDFDSFGNPRGPAIDPIGHAGRTYIPELGLYENRLRFYDPWIGRFIQEDPLGIAGGDVNPYRYAFNNPLLYIDASGQTAAIEYATLAFALARPGVFCEFAKCVADLWSGVTTAVLTLETTGEPPNATCPVKLLGLPCDGGLDDCNPSDLLDGVDTLFEVATGNGVLPPGVSDAAAVVQCLSE